MQRNITRQILQSSLVKYINYSVLPVYTRPSLAGHATRLPYVLCGLLLDRMVHKTKILNWRI